MAITITTPTAVYRLTDLGTLFRENVHIGSLRADLTADELTAWVRDYERRETARLARFDAVQWT